MNVAAAPPGLRCAEMIGSCLRWKVSRDRCVAWGLPSSFRTPNRILDMMNVRGLAAQQCHAGDADAVSTVCGAGNGVTFVDCSEMAEGAPLILGRVRPKTKTLLRAARQPLAGGHALALKREYCPSQACWRKDR